MPNRVANAPMMSRLMRTTARKSLRRMASCKVKRAISNNPMTNLSILNGVYYRLCVKRAVLASGAAVPERIDAPHKHEQCQRYRPRPPHPVPQPEVYTDRFPVGVPPGRQHLVDGAVPYSHN